jgi:hypothetical protein
MAQERVECCDSTQTFDCILLTAGLRFPMPDEDTVSTSSYVWLTVFEVRKRGVPCSSSPMSSQARSFVQQKST